MTRIWLVVLSIGSNVLALALPLALIQIYDRILANQAVGTAVVLLSAVAIAIMLDALVRFARSAIIARLGTTAEYHLSMRTAERILAMSRKDLLALGRGRIAELFATVGRTRDVLVGQSLLALFDAPFAIVFLALVWFLGGEVVLAPIAIVVVFGTAAIASMALNRAAVRRQFEASSVHRSQFVTAARNAELYRSIVIPGEVAARLRRSEFARSAASEQSEIRGSALLDISQVGGLASTVAILLLGALAVLDGTMTTGGLAACMILGQRAVGSLLGVISGLARRQLAAAAYRELDRVLRTARDADISGEGAGSSDRALAPIGIEISVPGHLIKAAPGEMVVVPSEEKDEELRLFGLVAKALLDAERPSGTAADPATVRLTEGSGTVNPDPRAVSVVPPLPPVFRGTILDNLTGFDDRRGQRAMALADGLGLTDLVGRLPAGFQTRLGAELSIPLSDGAVKRIGLVRGLSAVPGLVVLGHPEAALDKDGVDRLATTLREVCPETTVLAFTRSQPLLLAASTVVPLPASVVSEMSVSA
ncbi:hypothetical protein RDV64_14690 [Acuticoccus sp. MNP-M23]|uniref:hypothetical protein n=1 Tax=Acuticoccus sp. MNP-M23 TaxID=3072793 RepID=UPI0028154773|nr:hypothetical protein [Acuticoccus sp. MNP-M23]WMS41324.1 hypothetical protein RDV64_14690 [Acuticoccus sp. MNP-M23]